MNMIQFEISKNFRQTDGPRSKYNQKVVIQFRDSYILFGSKLRDLPEMFYLEKLMKEIFPYAYYT